MIKYPHANTRWMIVDFATQHVLTPVWSGRWVFGEDAGTWTTHAVTEDTYTVKDRRDARRDKRRLAALPRNAHL
jgi:hypothetical protein